MGRRKGQKREGGLFQGQVKITWIGFSPKNAQGKIAAFLEEAAETIIWLATLPFDGLTGGFFMDNRPIDW